MDGPTRATGNRGKHRYPKNGEWLLGEGASNKAIVYSTCMTLVPRPSAELGATLRSGDGALTLP